MQVLLHICCAVCATLCVERLRQEGHQFSGYFYNPNIQPPAEYLKRLGQAEQLAREQNFSLILGDYDVDSWFTRMRGLEDEPEGGRRCAGCFRLRLKETAKTAKEKGFNAFTTTLTLSPHKNTQVINEIGQDIDKALFLARDFKKQDGFKRAQELSKKYNLYHQNYCGCLYSLNQRQKDGRIYQKTCSIRDKSQTSPD